MNLQPYKFMYYLYRKETTYEYNFHETSGRRLIRLALQEDISSEDVTTNSVMKEAVEGEVQLICKQDGIVAGLDVFKRVFELLDENTKTEFLCKDGDAVKRDSSWNSYRRYSCAFVR